MPFKILSSSFRYTLNGLDHGCPTGERGTLRRPSPGTLRKLFRDRRWRWRRESMFWVQKDLVLLQEVSAGRLGGASSRVQGVDLARVGYVGAFRRFR